MKITPFLPLHFIYETRVAAKMHHAVQCKRVDHPLAVPNVVRMSQCFFPFFALSGVPERSQHAVSAGAPLSLSMWGTRCCPALTRGGRESARFAIRFTRLVRIVVWSTPRSCL